MASVPGLIADIGATNARFALADDAGTHSEQILRCVDYPGLADASRAYLELVRPSGSPKAASVAIAAPVTGDRVSMINHNWSFSIAETRKELGLSRLNVMNDFKALALAVPHLREGQDYRRVGEDGQALPGHPIGIVGPGTGLGVASLFWDGRHYHAAPGEGGHVTMPAKTQREFDVFRKLLETKYHHVSAERVCSGKGLANIYNALRLIDGRSDLPDREPEEISCAALDGSCPLCREALDMMLAFLGRIAGDLALTLGAFGGIYIAGGIVGKLGDYFFRSGFREEFQAKGRYVDYLKAIPTFVIQHPFPAFVGLRADLMGEGP